MRISESVPEIYSEYLILLFTILQALEKHCKAEAGYSGIRNVYQLPAVKDDVQQSFFFAEMLKVR